MGKMQNFLKDPLYMFILKHCKLTGKVWNTGKTHCKRQDKTIKNNAFNSLNIFCRLSAKKRKNGWKKKSWTPLNFLKIHSKCPAHTIENKQEMLQILWSFLAHLKLKKIK